MTRIKLSVNLIDEECIEKSKYKSRKLITVLIFSETKIINSTLDFLLKHLHKKMRTALTRKTSWKWMLMLFACWKNRVLWEFTYSFFSKDSPVVKKFKFSLLQMDENGVVNTYFDIVKIVRNLYKKTDDKGLTVPLILKSLSKCRYLSEYFW